MVDTILAILAVSINCTLNALVGRGVANGAVLVAFALGVTSALHAQTITGLAVLAGRALRIRLATVVDNVMGILLFRLLGPAAPEQDSQNGCHDDDTHNHGGIPVETQDLSI